MKINYYPYASVVELDTLGDEIRLNKIDTLICLPSFFAKLLLNPDFSFKNSLRNIFYLGEELDDKLFSRAKELLPNVSVNPLVYTTQETGPIGFQCAELKNNNYHIMEHIKINVLPDDELCVSIDYPSGLKVTEHRTGDIATISTKNCACGFIGSTIHLRGRVPLYFNYRGTSLSLNEFLDILRCQYNKNITIHDLQLLIVQEEKKSGIIIFINKKLESKCNKIDIIKKLRNSSLIREVVDDSDFFHVFFKERQDFLKSGVAGKVKPIVTLESMSRILNA